MYSTPGAGGRGSRGSSPLSPTNPVASELHSDPAKTSALLRDIAAALHSPLPSPADYVRQLEAEMAAQAGTPPAPRLPAVSTPTTAAVGQSAKDLVASLELLLQHPAATPGRRAMTALRRSHTAELGGGAGPTPPPGPGSAHAVAAAGAVAEVDGAPAVTPAALAAPTNRWRLAAARAASFRTPAAQQPSSRSPGGSGAGGAAGASAGASSAAASAWQRQVSFAPRPPASPAADLLAEIARAVSPGASSTAGPPSPAASPSFSSYATAAGAAPASPVPAWRAGSSAAGTAQQWGVSTSAVEEASRGLTGASPAAGGGAAGSLGRVELQPLQFCLQSPVGPDGMTFDEEASRLLEELWRFGALEQHAAAEFTSALAARLEQLFAVPAGC